MSHLSDIVRSNFVLNSTEYDALHFFDKVDKQTQVELETDSALLARKLLEVKGWSSNMYMYIVYTPACAISDLQAPSSRAITNLFPVEAITHAQ